MVKKIKINQNLWQLPIEDVCSLFQTNKDTGLSEKEVAGRKVIYGPNQLPEKQPIRWWHIFIRQFLNFMMMLLCIATALSFFLGKYFDALAIGLMIILNCVVGFLQEYSAQQALAALKKLITPRARVRRDGKELSILASHIVPGDIVVLDTGDAVPADGRLIDAILLKTEEASLTGESGTIEKNSFPINDLVTIADRKNMVFFGTHVVFGRGSMLVTATGAETELGAIATMLEQETEQITPLQKQLNVLSRQFVMLSFLFVGTAFVWGLILGQDILSQLVASLSLAVAAIPEGLPIIVTIALALGVKAMARHKTIVRRLSAVETLGCVSVICTDKTGTLTKNEMTAQSLWAGNKILSISGSGYNPVGNFYDGQSEYQFADDGSMEMALNIAALCNNANIRQQNSVWTITGDPTEAALVVAARKAGFEKEILEKQYRFVWERPFDAEHKTMSVLRTHDNEGLLFVKGAPDVVVKQSSFLHNKNSIDHISPEDINNIEAVMHEQARQGLRLIAVAYKKVRADIVMTDPTLESDLIFAGFFALADAPRPEVFQAIKECKTAGIRIIMITGDHKETALKIATDLGIVEHEAQALDGNDLEAMSDSELAQNVTSVSVYARVLAQHKLRLVKALKAQGLVVAMTGDGVNDAPAVKAADVGIAMGITGTDVTKEVADIIITDDNFASIVKAIRYGRGIYENIVKSVCYLISANMAELLVVFFTMLLHLGEHSGQLFVGLLPIQLIWINLITDGIPALALSADKTNDAIMTNMPRPRTEPIFSRYRALQSGLVSVSIALVTVGGGWYGFQYSMALGYTMALTILIALELVRAQTVRSEYNLSFFSNKWLVGAFIASFFVHLVVLYTKLGNRLLQTVPLSINDWGVVILCTVLAWLITKLLQKIIVYVTFFTK